MQLKHFERGEVIFREGEVGREAYRIVSGHVDITISEGGKTSHLGVLYAGEILGEMAMIEDKPRAATAQALTPTVVEVITEENFMDEVVADPERFKAYLGTLFERLRGMGIRLRQAIRAGLDVSDESRAPSEGAAGGEAPRETARSVEGIIDLTQGILLHGAQEGTAFELRVETFPFRIGRRLPSRVPTVFGPNDLHIDDVPPYQVSRNHCSIERTSSGFRIEDRGSKLGTIVNGISIGEASPRMSTSLRRGENVIVLGSPESRVRLRAIV